MGGLSLVCYLELEFGRTCNLRVESKFKFTRCIGQGSVEASAPFLTFYGRPSRREPRQPSSHFHERGNIGKDHTEKQKYHCCLKSLLEDAEVSGWVCEKRNMKALSVVVGTNNYTRWKREWWRNRGWVAHPIRKIGGYVREQNQDVDRVAELGAAAVTKFMVEGFKTTTAWKAVRGSTDWNVAAADVAL